MNVKLFTLSAISVFSLCNAEAPIEKAVNEFKNLIQEKIEKCPEENGQCYENFKNILEKLQQDRMFNVLLEQDPYIQAYLVLDSGDQKNIQKVLGEVVKNACQEKESVGKLFEKAQEMQFAYLNQFKDL